MRKRPLVMCRICREKNIDRDNQIEGVDWINPKTNYFYHKSCYDSWKKSEPNEDAEYKEFIYDFISRDMKVPYDFHKCEAQRKKFLKENMTNKGIFYSLKYYYELKHGDWNKGYGGIGIVPYIYKEACTYWANKERQNKGILQSIEEQMKKAQTQEVKVIHKKKKKKKADFDFEKIELMEDS